MQPQTEKAPNGQAQAQPYRGIWKVELRESVTFDTGQFEGITVPETADAIFAVRVAGDGTFPVISNGERYDGVRIERKSRRNGAKHVESIFVPSTLIRRMQSTQGK